MMDNLDRFTKCFFAACGTVALLAITTCAVKLDQELTERELIHEEATTLRCSGGAAR